MPTYVYECRDCGHGFETEQRISEDPLTDCPKCSKQGALRRVIQPTAVMFKGSGFHINDYSGKPAEAFEPAATPSESPTTTETAADGTD